MLIIETNTRSSAREMPLLIAFIILSLHLWRGSLSLPLPSAAAGGSKIRSRKLGGGEEQRAVIFIGIRAASYVANTTQ
jgi:hypothetical protein